jgi:predicted DNA-binding antitoxin AbrB/MazE fold protein
LEEKIMKTTKRIYNLSIKGTKNYQSVSVTEGFEVEVDKDFNELEFEVEKQKLKDKLTEETKKLLNQFTESRKIDDNIDLTL